MNDAMYGYLAGFISGAVIVLLLIFIMRGSMK